ncbi:hypothetical protein TONV_060 [Tipula oleracea nudivirus]|uniref:Uncharacterized protein n=1 Tax=Tipula oleracea nudivirus TaxID=1546257 RepID=A0A0B4VFF2_9VIRU|nr:hypothetical protein TONV_060 [Tipula oleracea nudivirus]AJD20120.1 hypothetical protein TONV_060 [Tipula oleracea nudivirus]
MLLGLFFIFIFHIYFQSVSIILIVLPNSRKKNSIFY